MSYEHWEGNTFNLEVFVCNSYTSFLHNTIWMSTYNSFPVVLFPWVWSFFYPSLWQTVLDNVNRGQVKWWSTEVLLRRAAGLWSMHCCPVETTKPPLSTALGWFRHYPFRCYRKAAPVFWQETLPHTHFRLFSSLCLLFCVQKLCQESTFVWARNRDSWYSASYFDCLAGRGWGNR